jgi:hypothetical protein
MEASAPLAGFRQTRPLTNGSLPNHTAELAAGTLPVV